MSEQNQQLRMTAWGVTGIGEIVPGDQLGDVIVEACQETPNGPLLDGDVLVVTQKLCPRPKVVWCKLIPMIPCLTRLL